MIRTSLFGLLCVLVLTACDREPPHPEMQKADEAAAQAGRAAKEAAGHAVDAAKHAGAAVKEEAKEAAERTDRAAYAAREEFRREPQP
ncbi:MAG TPA: hypothetical protein VJM53_01665 [Burkholderiales bacterium]|nr:hypothetical protein [Burkholderiales bacterium]